MTSPSKHIRHVWREVSDGNQTVKVLALQQWRVAEGWEHEDIVKNGGQWEDVDISVTEPKEGPL